MVQQRATGWTARFQFPAGAKYCSLLHRVPTGPGAHITSYPMGAGGSFPWDKVVGAWSWPLTSVYSRDHERWNYTSIPPYIFIAFCSIKHKENYLYLSLEKQNCEKHSLTSWRIPDPLRRNWVALRYYWTIFSLILNRRLAPGSYSQSIRFETQLEHR
jgi:hypothetical protein